MILDLVSYFYYDNEIFALPQLLRLNRVFDVLTGLFNRFGLRKNMQRTVSMTCQQYHAHGRMSVESFKRKMAGADPIFQHRHWRKVNFP